MNEQQLAAVKQALGALKKGTGWMEHGEIIADLHSIISQDALDKKADNARELGLSYDDAIKGGVGIMLGGKRIDPASIYAEPKIGCVNHDCDKCKAVQEPAPKTWELTTPATALSGGGGSGVVEVEWFKRPAPNCTRSHPHENMDAMCELRTEIARLTNENARLKAQPVPVKCWCHKCNEHNTVNGLPFSMTQMILCPECGNKRCPKASDHQLDCTGSNKAGQHGSVYTAPQPVPVKTYSDGKPWPVAPKPWVGLDSLEVSDLWLDTPFDDCTEETFEAGRAFVEAIETRLKEKNHDH
jgi:hypothetical protein